MRGVTLETPRLLLREPRIEDLDPWAALMADEAAARFIGGVQPRSVVWRGMAMTAGSWALHGFGMFSVIERASGAWIGRIGPWCPEGWPGREVGWGLRRSAWGRGYALEAARACMDFAFDALGWDEVIHVIHPENAASQALAARLGSSVLRRGVLPPPHDGKEYDIWGQDAARWRARAA